MTIKERSALQASIEHPMLYRMGQHRLTDWLHSLVWTPKALKTAKKLRTPLPRTPRVQRAYAPRTQPTMIINGNVNFY